MLFAAKESILNYYFSIICVSSWLVFVVFYSPLIWDAFINACYLMLDGYGLYYWLYSKKSQKDEITKVVKTRNLYKLEYFIYSIIGFLLIYIMTFIGIKFGKYSGNLQALTDATSTIIAILAKYLTAKKVLQSWILWMLVALISIPLYISINSYVLAMAWFLYLLNAIYGFYKWRKRMQIIPLK